MAERAELPIQRIKPKTFRLNPSLHPFDLLAIKNKGYITLYVPFNPKEPLIFKTRSDQPDLRVISSGLLEPSPRLRSTLSDTPDTAMRFIYDPEQIEATRVLLDPSLNNSMHHRRKKLNEGFEVIRFNRDVLIAYRRID